MFQTLESEFVSIQPDHVTALLPIRNRGKGGTRIYTGSQFFDVINNLDAVIMEIVG